MKTTEQMVNECIDKALQLHKGGALNIPQFKENIQFYMRIAREEERLKILSERLANFDVELTKLN